MAGEAFTAPYSAPSAGPPPWHLYRLAFHTAFGTATVEPFGATRWRLIAERVADLAEVLPGLSTVGRRRSAKPPCCDEAADPPAMNESSLHSASGEGTGTPKPGTSTRTRDPFLTICHR